MANTNGGRINFQVGYNVDQNSVNQVKKSLQDLQSIKFSNFDGTQKQFLDIKNTAEEVEQALNRAFNTKLGSLNSQDFIQSLQQMQGGINGVYQRLSEAGAKGQVAFSQVAKAAMTTNVQLRQTKSLINSMGQTMANTVKWGIASSIMNSFSNSVQQAFSYVKSLDSALTDIRIVTGDSTQQMAKFADQANRAAQELGRSTMDYTKAALTFYQQGLSDQDVQARTQAVLKAQNITGAGQEMADYLTAVWNGYKVANEEAELYVDKLAAVADSSASNMSQLATAMSKVASVANSLGVPVDSLNAQIATIVATTRNAPESVGNALKTIYSRINDISTGAQDAQISLGNYSSKMLQVGVSVLDANGNLRDTGQVIEQIGGKWESLSREQQIYLARTMAGQRQYNNLIALFDNWNRYTDLVNVSLDSQGSLMQKNSRYLDSLAAHMEQFGAAGERVKAALIDEEGLKGIVDLGTNITNIFGSFIESIGGGSGALLNFGSIFISLFSNTIAKEINNIVTNIQNAKANADILKQDIESTELFGASQGFQKDTISQMVKAKEAAQDYYQYMDQAQINHYNDIVQEIGAAKQQVLILQQQKEKTEDFISVFERANKIPFDKPLEDVIERASQVVNALQDISISYDKIKQNQSQDFYKDTFADLNSQFEQLKNAVGGQSVLEGLQGWDKYEEALLNVGEKGRITNTQLQNLQTTLRTLRQQALGKFNDIVGLDNTTQQLKQQNAQLQISTRKSSQYLNNIKQFSQIKIYTNAIAGLGQVASSLNNIINLTKVWKNENNTLGEKLLQTFTNLSFTIPMLYGGLKKIVAIAGVQLISERAIAQATERRRLEEQKITKQKILQATIDKFKSDFSPQANKAINKAQEDVNKASKALDDFDSSSKNIFQMAGENAKKMGSSISSAFGKAGAALSKTAFSIGGLSVSFAALAGIAAGVVAAGVGIYMWYTKDARAAQKAAKAAQQTNNKYKDLKETLDNFNTAISGYDESIKALQELNKGTEQWNQKLKETNEQVLELLENYPQLAGAISQNADGLLTINKQSEEYQNFLDSLNKTTQTANIARLGAQQTSNEAQRTSLITNAARDIGGLDRASLEKLVGAMQTNGNAIIGNNDYLSKELGLTQQQINAIHDNVDKITTLATTIQNNTKATEILGNTISQDLLKDNSAYQNSEYQEEFAEDISNKLANAQFDVNKYSSYDSDGVQRLDKNAMAQAYAVATGEQIKTTWYGAFKVFNEQTKQWEKISADVVKNEIAAADAINNLDQYIKDTQQTINKASQTFEDLASAALKFRNVNSEEDLKNVDVKQLSQFDVKSLNAQDLVDTFELEIDPDILADWLEKQATLIEKNTRQFIQKLPLGVQDAFKNLDTSKMSGELQSQMASVLKDAFVKSGGKSLDQLTDFYSRIEQDQLEQVLQIQSSLDFTSLSVEDFRDILEDADIQTNATNGQLRDFINRMAEIQQQAQQLSPEQRYKAIQDITSGLSKGDTISAEDKDTLQSYGIDVESFFKPLADGTWELKGRAQQFAKIAKDVSLQGLRDQIDLLKNKIDQVNQYTEDDLLKYVGPQQGATVGTEGVSIEKGSEAQQLASQQIDFIELIGAAEEQSIANWRYAIQEKGQISKDQLAQIYTLVEENKDKIGNLSEEQVQRLKQLQDELYNSSRPPLDPDVDESKYEALSDYLHEYGEAIQGVSKDVRASQEDADDLAQAWLRYDSALGQIIDKYDDWETVLTSGSVLQQAQAAQELQNVYSDLLDLPYENLSPDFTTSIDNLHLLQEAANGSEDAYNQLREAAMQDIAAQVGLDTSQFYTEEGALYDEYNLIQNELDDIEVGAYIDNAQALQSMNEIINAAGMTAQQATDLLASMGVDATVEQVAVPQTQRQEVIGMTPHIDRYPVQIPQILGDGTVSTETYQIPQISYEPVYNTAVAQGSKTTTALRVTSAKKSSGGGIKYNMASNGAGSKGQAARAPKGGGGKKGGGGGKGSSPKTTRVEPKAKAEPTQKKEAPHDPYQQNTKALERQEDLIDDLQDAEKKLLDKDRLKNLEKQNEALEEQAKILQDRLAISQQAGQKNTTAWFAKELQSAFGKNIGFDADGRIADRNKAQAAAVAAYNAAVTKADKEYQAARQKYNANAGKQLTDAQKKQIQNQLKAAEDKKKKAIDKAKEQYDEKTKLLDAYEKRWQEDQKTREQIEKAWQQYYENSILHQQIKIDLKIDSGDFERDWLDFEKKFIKKLDKNDFLGQAKANAKQLASYFNSGQIEAVSQRINSIREQIKKMQEGVTSEIYGNNLAQAREDLETYMKQQMDDLQKIQDLTEEIQQNYLDAIDKAKDKMDDQIDQYERVNSLIDHNVKLTQLLYGDKAYDTMDKYFQKRRENDQAELDSLRKQQLYWQQKMDQETPGSEAWQRFKKNVDDTTDQLNSKLEDMIQNLSDQWENRVDGIIQKLNNALTGGRGLDYLDEQWDYINNYDDKFLDTVESKMGVQDVERLYNNAIDGLAGNPKAQQRINNLMKDQLKILKEKDHLTEYDLERAKAMLQVEQARMDLEDARNNKTKMRLRRDSQGNYTYQYVADEQKLGDLQDALADAQANLYNMDKQHYKQNLNDMYDTYKDYINKMRELTAAYNATQDQEERDRIQARINLLKDSTDALMEGLTDDNQVTLYKYLGQSYFDAMGIDPSSFTQEEQFNILRENVPQVQSNIQDLADTIIGEGGILPATAAYMEQIAQATKEYDQAVQDTLTAAGTSTDIIHDVVDDEGKFLDDNINKAKELVTENDKLIASVDKEITAIQQLLDWLDKYLNKAMNIEEIVRRLRGGFDFYQELKDSDTTAEVIPVTKTPSDTTTGNEYSGSEINPGNSKSTQDQLAALQTSAEYNGMIAENTEATADAISELQHSTISQPEDIPPIDTNATGLDPESISNAAALGAVLASMLNSLAEQDLSTLQGLISTSLGHIDNVEELNQNVHIEANFPNVNASAQIEAAFVELVNTAAMYTSRYQKE